MPLMLVKDLTAEEQARKSCLFCTKNEDNELLYGKFYSTGKLTAHYYCLLFSSGLEQKGRDDEGILGFLAQDIEKESRRGSKLNCSKCRKSGATVGCCNKACKRTYHFPCGYQARMLNQFFGAFHSYCATHQPVQKVAELVRGSPGANGRTTCTICQEEVATQASFDVLWAPCCKKQSWFHRHCMQRMALSAGYFFKCPICSNNNQFVNEMKRMGIYVPEQDASWELEPNAFQELVQRHDKCDHPNCICPKGRTYDGDGTRWELILCCSCGSKGVHIGCGRLEWNVTEWDCDDCSKLGRSNAENGANDTSNSQQNNARRSLFSSFSTEPASNNNVSTTVPVPASEQPNLRPGMKRPHPEQDLPSDESDVDVTSFSDADSSAKSPRYDSRPSPPHLPTSRNVARRGGCRVGSASSSRNSTRCNTARQELRNLEKLRFRVNEDSTKIIVYLDRDNGSPAKTYTIPVDQPLRSPGRRKK